MFYKLKTYFLCSLVMAGLAFTSSCSKDDDGPDDPNKPGNVDANTSVADPVGTVTMRMRNDNETKLGQMIVSPENNFSCDKGMIASIGKVAGLGNITDIPLTGWSDNVAVVIGNGYVYYDGNQYYRIYAVQWLMEAGTSDNIIGVELKYQAPFKGVDEDITPESPALSFSDEGGTDQIKFTNTSVIPFTVESDQNWCRVSRWASNDKNEKFLYDGIEISVIPNDEMEQSSAKVTIKTLYGKRTIINVTRAGQSPVVFFPNGETEYAITDVDANGHSKLIDLTTNIEPEDLKAVPNVEWIVIDESKSNLNSRSTRNLTLRYTVRPNYTAAQREGRISFSSVKGEKNSVMTITQLPGEMTASDPIEIAASVTDANVSFTTNVTGTYTVASSASWCRVANITNNIKEVTSTGRFSLRLDMDPNTTETDRKAVITVTAQNGTLRAQTEVTQKGVSFENVPKILYFSKNHQNTTITLPAKDLQVKSSADWCSVVVNGLNLTILVDDTTIDRTATISIENTSAKIEIDQSKYAVGDDYNEKGIVGTVCVMDGATRLVRSNLLGTAAYSTENFSIGATDRKDGMTNMTKVKSLTSWKKYYPAFALCDELNVNGVTGWYLPAVDEHIGISGWSSTETGENSAYAFTGRTTTTTSSKSTNREVYAVHLFVK